MSNTPLKNMDQTMIEDIHKVETTSGQKDKKKANRPAASKLETGR